jgi:hypothetical protein
MPLPTSPFGLAAALSLKGAGGIVPRDGDCLGAVGWRLVASLALTGRG